MMSKIIILVFIGIILCAGGGYVAIAGNPLKITDPADPKFNPDKFSFNDYKNLEEMSDAFRKLFPVGTDREFVEKILVQAGGAEIYSKIDGLPPNSCVFVRYTEPYRLWRQFKEAAVHIFLYNPDNNKLINIHPFLGGKLFQQEMGLREFDKLNGGKYE